MKIKSASVKYLCYVCHRYHIFNDLSSAFKCNIVFDQEHLLSPFDLPKLCNITENYTTYSCSASMTVDCGHNLWRSPESAFGGVIIYVINSLSGRMKGRVKEKYITY